MKNKWVVWLIATVLLAALLPVTGQASVVPLAGTGLAQGDDLLISRAQALRASAAIAYDDHLDRYLVVWADGRQNVLNPDIYGQFISSDGIPQGDNFIIRDESHSLGSPDVAYDTVNQRYLVVWEDGSEDDVEGIVLKADGTAYAAAINIADGTSSDSCNTPSVAFHPPTATYFVAYRNYSATWPPSVETSGWQKKFVKTGCGAHRS
jgi:hypothetical protein